MLERDTLSMSSEPNAHDSQPHAGIYLMAAHPDWRNSRVLHRLLTAARAMAITEGMPALDIHDLYHSYPDYSIDVAAEQERIANAKMVVLMHPIQWYSMPALQKLWIDEVLTYGWAYGAVSTGTGDNSSAPANAPGTALRGKKLWLVATTSAAQDDANAMTEQDAGAPFLPPYREIAAVCGMTFLPPLVLHNAQSAGKEQVKTHIELFKKKLAYYGRAACGLSDTPPPVL